MKTRNANAAQQRKPPPELDAIAIDITQRLVAGKEPWIRPEFRGLSVPAEDLAFASEFVLGRLKEFDLMREVSSQERRRRAVDLDRTAKELRRTFLWQMRTD